MLQFPSAAGVGFAMHQAESVIASQVLGALIATFFLEAMVTVETMQGQIIVLSPVFRLYVAGMECVLGRPTFSVNVNQATLGQIVCSGRVLQPRRGFMHHSQLICKDLWQFAHPKEGAMLPRAPVSVMPASQEVHASLLHVLCLITKFAVREAAV